MKRERERSLWANNDSHMLTAGSRTRLTASRGPDIKKEGRKRLPQFDRKRKRRARAAAAAKMESVSLLSFFVLPGVERNLCEVYTHTHKTFCAVAVEEEENGQEGGGDNV